MCLNCIIVKLGIKVIIIYILIIIFTVGKKILESYFDLIGQYVCYRIASRMFTNSNDYIREGIKFV
jgi:hypothetical protein